MGQDFVQVVDVVPCGTLKVIHEGLLVEGARQTVHSLTEAGGPELTAVACRRQDGVVLCEGTGQAGVEPIARFCVSSKWTPVRPVQAVSSKARTMAVASALARKTTS